MYNNDVYDEIKRLKFEDLLWIIFALLSLMNVYGDYSEEEYLKTGNNYYEKKSNTIFELTLLITLFIYIYFFQRNYNLYESVSEKEKNLYIIKLLGSSLLIAGILCLLYFQTNQTTFTGSPAL